MPVQPPRPSNKSSIGVGPWFVPPWSADVSSRIVCSEPDVARNDVPSERRRVAVRVSAIGYPPMTLQWCNRIAHAQQTAGHDPGADSAATDQRLQHRLAGELDQMFARGA